MESHMPRRLGFFPDITFPFGDPVSLFVAFHGFVVPLPAFVHRADQDRGRGDGRNRTSPIDSTKAVRYAILYTT